MVSEVERVIIEVSAVKDCSDCVFCEEMIFCKLKDGEPCDTDPENGRNIASFCPLLNPSESVTNKVKVVQMT